MYDSYHWRFCEAVFDTLVVSHTYHNLRQLGALEHEHVLHKEDRDDKYGSMVAHTHAHTHKTRKKLTQDMRRCLKCSEAYLANTLKARGHDQSLQQNTDSYSHFGCGESMTMNFSTSSGCWLITDLQI